MDGIKVYINLFIIIPYYFKLIKVNLLKKLYDFSLSVVSYFIVL